MKSTVAGQHRLLNKLDIAAGILLICWSVLRLVLVMAKQTDGLTAQNKTSTLPMALAVVGVFAGVWICSGQRQGFITAIVLGVLYGLVMMLQTYIPNILFAIPNLVLIIYSVFRLSNPVER